MAKKLKTADYLLLGTIAVGGAGYYLWKQGKLPFVDKLITQYGKKPPMDSASTEKPIPDTTPVAEKKIVFTPPVDPTKNPIYVSKVKKIQGYVNTGIDGDAGSKDSSNTNQALKKKFPKEYASYGRLTPTNVDKYIDAIVKEETSVVKLQKDTDARKQRMAFGDKLKNLYYKDKAKIVRTNDTNSPTKYLDKARNQYANDGGSVTIYKNEALFPKYSFVAYDTNGFWILRTASGKFIITNPNEYVAK
jgi:hypothetical protein